MEHTNAITSHSHSHTHAHSHRIWPVKELQRCSSLQAELCRWLLLFWCFSFCYCTVGFVVIFLNLFRIVNSIILTFYCIFITFCDIIKRFYEFSLSLFAALKKLFLFSPYISVFFSGLFRLCFFRCSSSERKKELSPLESSWVEWVLCFLRFVWIWWMHLFPIGFNGD